MSEQGMCWNCSGSHWFKDRLCWFMWRTQRMLTRGPDTHRSALQSTNAALIIILWVCEGSVAAGCRCGGLTGTEWNVLAGVISGRVLYLKGFWRVFYTHSDTDTGLFTLTLGHLWLQFLGLIIWCIVMFYCWVIVTKTIWGGGWDQAVSSSYQRNNWLIIWLLTDAVCAAQYVCIHTVMWASNLETEPAWWKAERAH